MRVGSFFDDLISKAKQLNGFASFSYKYVDLNLTAHDRNPQVTQEIQIKFSSYFFLQENNLIVKYFVTILECNSNIFYQKDRILSLKK